MRKKRPFYSSIFSTGGWVCARRCVPSVDFFDTCINYKHRQVTTPQNKTKVVTSDQTHHEGVDRSGIFHGHDGACAADGFVALAVERNARVAARHAVADSARATARGNLARAALVSQNARCIVKKNSGSGSCNEQEFHMHAQFTHRRFGALVVERDAGIPAGFALLAANLAARKRGVLGALGVVGARRNDADEDKCHKHDHQRPEPHRPLNQLTQGEWRSA
jgi:hypothetical protein